MSPKQEEKKEPVSGNTGSSDEQEMEDVEEQDEDLVNEDDFDLEGKKWDFLRPSHFNSNPLSSRTRCSE